jgi:hypothetical protein
MTNPFSVGDIIRLTKSGNVLTGMEGRIVSFGRKSDFGQWLWNVPIIKITKEPLNPWYKGQYPVGSVFPRGSASIENLTVGAYELVHDQNDLPRVIKPEEVEVGDKISVEWTSDNIERRDIGTVARVRYDTHDFRNKEGINIGPILCDNKVVTLLDRKVKHPLEDAVVGHVFKRTSTTGATNYKLTKLRDDHWAVETTKGAHLISVVIVGEIKARTFYDS